MASFSKPVTTNRLIDPHLPGEYALEAVADDLVDLMRTCREDKFISTICADQIEHFRTLNRAGAEDDKTQRQPRRHSTPPTPNSSSTRPPSIELPSPAPETATSPRSDSGGGRSVSIGGGNGKSVSFDPQLSLLLYLHQKTQSLPILLNMARTCHGMDENALGHNEFTIRNLLARVRVLGATLEDREFLDHLYSVKQVLWDKIVAWRMLEDKRCPGGKPIFTQRGRNISQCLDDGELRI